MKLTAEQTRVMEQVKRADHAGVTALLEFGVCKPFHRGSIESLIKKGLIEGDRVRGAFINVRLIA